MAPQEPSGHLRSAFGIGSFALRDDQAEFIGENHRLSTVTEAHLREDPVDMRFDGVVGDRQPERLDLARQSPVSFRQA